MRAIPDSTALRDRLLAGLVIPAHPLALDRQRQLDERRQRALTRYYVEAGAGGIAIGVHTTQFELRDHGMLGRVLGLASQTALDWSGRLGHPHPPLRIAGICGRTEQALEEAVTARNLDYDLGLLSLAAYADDDESTILMHCEAVAQELTLFGFYLQPAVGGRPLSRRFWSKFCEIDNIAAIKVAPFDRYRTLDVVRAVVDSGRDHEIALYTGNDDSIVIDLLSAFQLAGPGKTQSFAGGLLGQWALWTKSAVELLSEIRELRRCESPIPPRLLRLAAQLTDANAAIFDPSHAYAGCIPGIHEVLRRQGLLEGIWCLDPTQCLSPGQDQEIDRVVAAYPHLTDDQFVSENLDRWMSD